MENMSQYLQALSLLLTFYIVKGQEYTVVGVFQQGPPLSLINPLKLSCRDHGDKIKVSDILYKTTGCRNTPTKPQDPATEKNKEHIDQCTGKRTCVVPVEYITRPFLPRNPTGCSTSTQYQISVIYTCVPQELIKSMCSSFNIQEYMGYLSTPSYPMLLKPGEPVAPCRCHLEGTLNSRISLTLLESNLEGNISKDDMHACQLENVKQYLEIAYNRGNYYSYYLCSHKYNLEVTSSSTYDLVFESPINREAGSLWIQYSAEEPNSMVTVSCVEPILTTTAPIYYTKAQEEYSDGGGSFSNSDTSKYRLILGIVAAMLFLLIIIAVVIITVKYNRRISHYMMHKYSFRRRHNGGGGELSPSMRPGNSSRGSIRGYLETHFDHTDETMCGGKPTAHIPPQLSVTEKLNRTADESDPKAKLVNGQAQYSSFTSTYVLKQAQESEGEDTRCQPDNSPKSPTGSNDRLTSSPAPNKKFIESQGKGLIVDTSHAAPKFEDIWVRVNSPEMTSKRDVLSTKSVSDDRKAGQLNKPPSDLSFSSAGIRVDLPDMQTSVTLPLLSTSDESRSHSEDEEEDMDIKLVNMNLVTPFKAPVHAVKPAIKTSVSLHSPRYASSRRDSVKFSDIIERPSSDLSHRGLQADSQRLSKLKKPLDMQHQPLPKYSPKLQPYLHQPVDDYHPPLKVDLTSNVLQQTRSLPAASRHSMSAFSLQNFSKSPKRPKRKYASDQEFSLESSQEHLCDGIPVQSPRSRQRDGRHRNGSLKHQRNRTDAFSRRTDQELSEKVNNDLYNLTGLVRKNLS